MDSSETTSLMRNGEWPGLFPETSLTMIQAIQGKDHTQASAALNNFALIYSNPMVRLVQNLGVARDESRDLVHDYFQAVLIKRKALERMASETWRLRRFLRVTLTRFVRSYYRKQLAQKRGGLLRKTVFEESKAPLIKAAPDIMSFERDWTRMILARVDKRLRFKYRRPGREALFDVLFARLERNGREEPLAVIAAKFGKNEAAIKTQLKRIRDSYCELLREEVAATVHDDGEVDREIRYLFKIIESGPS